MASAPSRKSMKRFAAVMFFWLCVDVVISLVFPINSGLERGELFGGVYAGVGVAIWYGMGKARHRPDELALKTREQIEQGSLEPGQAPVDQDESGGLPRGKPASPPPAALAGLNPSTRVRYTIETTRETTLENLVQSYEGGRGKVKDVKAVED